MSFGKIYAQTFTGSMFGAGPAVFAIWSYAIANLKPPGIVELNPRMLSAILGASVDEIRKGIHALTLPDPESRSKEHGGRRLIQQGEYMYFSPTFERYRNGTEAERKAANAARQRRHREKNKTPPRVMSPQPPKEQ